MNTITNLDAILFDFFDAPYQGGSNKHEQFVLDTFKSHGYTEITYTDEKPKDRLEMLSDGTIMAQPMGTQAHPDFVIMVEGKIIKIECKSSKSGVPMMNGGRPDGPDTIYILESPKGSTVFLSEALCSSRSLDNLSMVHTKLKEFAITLCDQYNIDDILVYPRMNLNYLGKGKTGGNMVTTPVRDTNEKNILNFTRNMYSS